MKTLVGSYDIYRSLIAGKRLNNNGYFASEVKRYIAQGRLRCIDAGDMLFLIFSEGAYEQLVIYAKDDFASAPSGEVRQALCAQGELPWVCNVVFRSEDDAAARELSAYVRELGFCTEYVNYEYSLPDAQWHANQPCCLSDGLQIKCATAEYADRIRSLWQSSLPAFVLSSLDPEEMDAYIADGKLLILTDSNEELCGALHYTTALGKTTIHHLVVASEHRGRGLGGCLIDAWLAKAQGAKLALTWVEENNTASSNLFQRCGFRRTGKVSYQYVRRQS